MRVEGILDVALTDDAEMANHANREIPEILVLLVVECLRRRDHDRLAGVDAHGIHVLHVADRHAVVGDVTHDLVFDLFPPGQVLLDQDLRRADERAARQRQTLVLIASDARTFATERVSRAQHHREADGFRSVDSRLRAAHRLAACRLHTDLAQRVDEEAPIFRGLD
jgi:hypothetical protein